MFFSLLSFSLLSFSLFSSLSCLLEKQQAIFNLPLDLISLLFSCPLLLFEVFFHLSFLFIFVLFFLFRILSCSRTQLFLSLSLCVGIVSLGYFGFYFSFSSFHFLFHFFSSHWFLLYLRERSPLLLVLNSSFLASLSLLSSRLLWYVSLSFLLSFIFLCFPSFFFKLESEQITNLHKKNE